MMEKRNIPNSELVLSGSGRVYHLDLKPGDIADTIFLVGDPGRVKTMSGLFDTVELKTENREFVCHTGTYKGKRISVLSTGIGTDNVDIVLNEVDALFNIDLYRRKIRERKQKLSFIRIGTSGSLRADVPPGSYIVSRFAGGLDNLMSYYDGIDEISDISLSDRFHQHMKWTFPRSRTYFTKCSEELEKRFTVDGFISGITLSAPGFYGPQGRSLRLRLSDPQFIDKLGTFQSHGLHICNFEMESSALYSLSRLLGHDAITICMTLANRQTGKFLTDYHAIMKGLLLKSLDLVLESDVK